MTWPIVTETNWGYGEEASYRDNQPVDANTIIYAGCPAGFNANSSPAGCIRPLSVATPDVFAGFCVRSADNTTASAANPNPWAEQNVGDGTTGPSGAKVRLCVQGYLYMQNSQIPGSSGALGGITGAAGTQADVGSEVYYNGTGFTLTSSSNVQVGVIAAVLSDAFSNVCTCIRFRSGVTRNS